MLCVLLSNHIRPMLFAYIASGKWDHEIAFSIFYIENWFNLQIGLRSVCGVVCVCYVCIWLALFSCFVGVFSFSMFSVSVCFLFLWQSRAAVSSSLYKFSPFSWIEMHTSYSCHSRNLMRRKFVVMPGHLHWRWMNDKYIRIEMI